MDDKVKGGKAVMIIAAVALVFFIFWLVALKELSRQKILAVNKAALSMELEEKNAKLEKEKADLSKELKDTQGQLTGEKAAHEITKKTLSQEQVAENALKIELERVTRLNEKLENGSKEALDVKKE